MKYFSTGKNSEPVSFKEALLQGLAPDRGLYLPESFPKADSAIFEKDSFQDMAFEMAKLLVDGEIPDADLRKLTDDAFNFDVPVKKVHDNIYALELYHGPTAAFKDFGARFMARAMSYFLGDKKLTILVATSGDTGSAVAKGFYGLPNIDVIILYPSGKVSPLQEKQLTTLGKNITALEIDGTFDECQALVKEAFMDDEVKGWLDLSSANSINIGRLYPQSFYYCWAYRQLKSIGTPVLCTPSGNFGNITAGLFAQQMGLPIKRFIAANNSNDIFYQYLQTGEYRPQPSVPTIANAMDVGDPSNFARILDLYGNSHEEICQHISGYTYTDDEIAETLKDTYARTGYLLDPHGACGYRALTEGLQPTEQGVFLETAHPAKFYDTVKPIIQSEVQIPERLQAFMKGTKQSVPMSAQFEDFKAYLMQR